MSRSVLPLTLALLFVPALAEAQTVRLTLGPDAAAAAQRLMIDTTDLEKRIGDLVRAQYGLADVKRFLELSADAQSLANKGLAADYTSTFDRWVFGFGVNVAVATGESDLDALKSSIQAGVDRVVPVSAGVQLGLLVGVRLDDHLFAYLNGLAYPMSVRHFKASGYNFGAHLQYRLFDGVGSKVLVEWGGFAVTTGVEVSRATYELEDQVDAPVPLGSDLQMLTSSTGHIQIVQRALSVPVELTTSLRILYLVSLYGGVGADLQLGGASASLDVDTKLAGEITGQSSRLDLGTAKIIFDGEGDPQRVVVRFLGGVAANVGPVHAFAQLNVLAKDLTVGVAAGLRLGF